MPTSSASSSSESTLESRLFKRLDGYMTEIKNALSKQDEKIDRQGEKIDKLSERQVTRDEHDAERRRVDTLATEVAVHNTRLQTLETGRIADDSARRDRPFKTWQLVVGIVTALVFCFFDLAGLIVAIVNMMLYLHR